jgi:lipid II:glycine glycyltransferase (peptidoglycan interpeptide bridge formation enzyme)
MQDIRQSKVWKTYADIKGWKIVEIPSVDGKHKMQASILPLEMLGLNFLKLQRSDYDPDWSVLKKIKRENWVVSSIIEPKKIEDVCGFKKAGYRLSNFPYLAAKTIIIDLRLTTKKLWRNLSENTRRLVNKNVDCEIRKVKADVFLNEWKKFSKIWTMKLSEMEYLKEKLNKNILFLLCYKNDVCQSGIMIIKSLDTCNYYQSFTTDAGRSTGAHFFLVWKTMCEAKEKGLKYFDFEGVYDPRWPQKKWIGFTAFKNKFGGKETIYPGSYSRWF